MLSRVFKILFFFFLKRWDTFGRFSAIFFFPAHCSPSEKGSLLKGKISFSINTFSKGWQNIFLTVIPHESESIHFNPSPAEPRYTLSLQTVDPDQLASEEANRSGSALFVIKYENLYQQPGSSNPIG